MSSFDLNTVLGQWIPYGFGIIGILILLIGIIKLITNQDKAFNSIFTGIFVIVIAVGLRILLNEIVLPAIA